MKYWTTTQPSVGGAKDISYVAHGDEKHTEFLFRSHSMRKITGKYLAHIRRIRGWNSSKCARQLGIKTDALRHREHYGISTLEKFITHCQKMNLNPVEVFEKCYEHLD